MDGKVVSVPMRPAVSPNTDIRGKVTMIRWRLFIQQG